MLDYTSPTFDVNTAVTTGTELARKRLSSIQRAFLAADLALGRLIVVKLTVAQAATLAESNVIYARAALRTGPNERALIEAGRKALIVPSSVVLDRIVAAAGTEAVWDAIVRQL